MEDGFLCFGAAMMVSYCAAWLVDLALIGSQAAADEEAARFMDDVAGELRRRGGSRGGRGRGRGRDGHRQADGHPQPGLGLIMAAAPAAAPALEKVVIAVAAGGVLLYHLARLGALVARGHREEKRRAARRREQYVAEARAARLEGLKREIRGKAVDWWSAHKKGRRRRRRLELIN
ncbi:hypothetical protein OsJ_14509 [Oryza sativa Japonica Group]|uniref:Uncharacterized protein n=1 Tax=Oryza sativa subsp. japonica TaxID=39947 RepID=A3AT24_ORYSJ|nr:hypothetical protein OsJ_14509 [Oryza sativa Japonica Group]